MCNILRVYDVIFVDKLHQYDEEFGIQLTHLLMHLKIALKNVKLVRILSLNIKND